MGLKLEKMKQNRIFQSVVDQIEKAIIDGSLKPGDRLPSEMKLKNMLATSRGTVREALRVLEQKGLIDIKTGVEGGAVVKAESTETISENLDLLIRRQKVSFDHLAEFRHQIEGIVAALAAERATKTDIENLRGLLGQAEELLAGGLSNWNALIRVDIQLHIALAQIARNPIFVAVLEMVHKNILGSSPRFSPKDEHLLEEACSDFRNIVNAVERGKANEARSLAHDHIRRFNQYMKRESQESDEGHEKGSLAANQE
jgi:DNA-binding FadR family transcriptional regulator